MVYQVFVGEEEETGGIYGGGVFAFMSSVYVNISIYG